MLIEGKLVELILILIIIGLYYYMLSSVKGGKKYSVRRLPAIDAIDAGIGRAVETNRPVHFTPGAGGGALIDEMNTMLIAGMNMLPYIASKCASMGAELITTWCVPELVPLARSVIDDAYRAEGKIEDLNVHQVRFLSSKTKPYAAGVLGIMQRERPAVNIMIGGFSMEALQFGEAGHISGGMMIGGTAETAQLPFFLTAFDYALIAEEIYAASAYASGDPESIGTVVVQDYLRIIGIGLIILVVISATFNSDIILNLLKM